MKLYKSTLIFSTIIVLTGCADLLNANKDPFNWTPYLDIDGSIQYVDFFQRVIAEKDANKLEIVRGEAIQKMQFSNLSSYKSIGDLYASVDGDGYAMGTIFLDGKKSLNPYLNDDINVLSKSKQFDFYEFGKGRVGHAKFSAKNQICKDFRSKNGVDIVVATSYYDKNDRQSYYSSLIKANINNEEVRLKDYKPTFTSTNKNTLEMMKEDEAKYGNKVVKDNLYEKASILINKICK